MAIRRTETNMGPLIITRELKIALKRSTIKSSAKASYFDISNKS
jgi:hypothetical protein